MSGKQHYHIDVRGKEVYDFDCTPEMAEKILNTINFWYLCLDAVESAKKRRKESKKFKSNKSNHKEN